eukprot:1573962-Pleurochrysis_carterae.AAC.1
MQGNKVRGSGVQRACRHICRVSAPQSGCPAHWLSDVAPRWRRRHMCGSYGEDVRSSCACDIE